MGKTKYKTVKVPHTLQERFLKIQERFGYRSFNEFVVDAVRRLLDELEGVKKE